VPTARRLVTPLMTSRDYDVILVMSQSSKLSLRKLGSTIRRCGHYIAEDCVQNQPSRLRTLAKEEAFGVTLHRLKA